MQVVVGNTGANEGTMVGEADGTLLDGFTVGRKVGLLEVGSIVGNCDTVGDADGEYDKVGVEELGLQVGNSDGKHVGIIVGAELGI